MDKLRLPLVSKWACIFSIKGRARYLDMLQIYADGSLDRYPIGSICLDAPLVLLDPEHPKFNPTRPSNIAQACDLFGDPACYAFLKMIENSICEQRNFAPEIPRLFLISEYDSQYLPREIIELDYGQALEQLKGRIRHRSTAPKFNKTS